MTRRFSTDTHCVNNHEYTEANTRIRPDGFRCCRTCHRDGVRRHKARQKARKEMVTA